MRGIADYYLSTEFSANQFKIKNDRYSHIDIHFKTKDKSYIINGIDGIFFPKKCK